MAKLSVEVIPILTDNYVFVIADQETKNAVIVDPGEANPCIDYLKSEELNLVGVLITHHHNDHIDGLPELKNYYKMQKSAKAGDLKIFAPQKNRIEIREANIFVQHNQLLDFDGFKFKVFELPGHTLGHIAYYAESPGFLFSGDVIFGLGCGRLFEGTPEQMFASLNVVRKLPPETLIYCTHEYTEKNLKFCQKLIKKDMFPRVKDSAPFFSYEKDVMQKRSQNFPTVPLELKKELQANPFFLARDVHELAGIRLMRNTFKV